MWPDYTQGNTGKAGRLDRRTLTPREGKESFWEAGRAWVLEPSELWFSNLIPALGLCDLGQVIQSL